MNIVQRAQRSKALLRLALLLLRLLLARLPLGLAALYDDDGDEDERADDDPGNLDAEVLPEALLRAEDDRLAVL